MKTGYFIRQLFKAAGGVALSVFCLSACAMAPVNNDTRLLDLQNQIDKTNMKVDEIHHRMSVMQFMIDNQQKTIQELEALRAQAQEPSVTITEVTPETSPVEVDDEAGLSVRPDAAASPVQPAAPATQPSPAAAVASETKPAKPPQELYDEALAAYKNNRFPFSLSLFESFLNQYPDHKLSDNALYWSGECLYSQKQFAKALHFFKTVVEKYPNGSKASDAMLKIAYTYLNLDDPAKAKYYFKEVIRTYPFSPAADKAEQKLKHIKAK